jgi:hypothetical protein
MEWLLAVVFVFLIRFSMRGPAKKAVKLMTNAEYLFGVR